VDSFALSSLSAFSAVASTCTNGINGLYSCHADPYLILNFRWVYHSSAELSHALEHWGEGVPRGNAFRFCPVLTLNMNAVRLCAICWRRVVASTIICWILADSVHSSSFRGRETPQPLIFLLSVVARCCSEGEGLEVLGVQRRLLPSSFCFWYRMFLCSWAQQVLLLAYATLTQFGVRTRRTVNFI
jgi:hypothetical protein